jgi:hypothetical protein
MSQSYARFGAFRIAFLITLVLLVIQYVLGMIANLEVQFPGNLPDGNAWGWVWSHSLIIQLHIYTGTLLLVVALVALILSMVVRHIVGIITAAAGLALIIFAWLSGAEFLARSQQNDLSLRMALGFMGAFVAYILGYYLSRSLYRKHAYDAKTNRDSLIIR